jgi:hypothetical protein
VVDAFLACESLFLEIKQRFAEAPVEARLPVA